MKKASKNGKKGGKTLIIIFLVLGVLFLGIGIFLLIGKNDSLTVTHYTIKTDKISGRIRIVQISDLHSNYYGEDQEELLGEIDRLSPDVVVITGDLFDHRVSEDGAEALLKGLSGRYPLYYVTGNHEYYKGLNTYYKYMSILSRYDVQRLSGQAFPLSVGNDTIWIAGVDDPFKTKIGNAEPYLASFEEQLIVARQVADRDRFTVLLSHRPEKMTEYARRGYDLVLSGHAHGGQIRIPGTEQGLFAPHQGLFPKYTGGTVYEEGDTKMIVSRGLARDALYQPRVFNPPELVVIDVTKE